MLLVLDGLVGFAAVLTDPKAMPKVCAVLEGGPRFGLTRAHERLINEGMIIFVCS